MLVTNLTNDYDITTNDYDNCTIDETKIDIIIAKLL